MNEQTEAKRRPWNLGKLIGPKPPLQPKHVWAIRTQLQIACRGRDLALLNVAIDSKLRGCDVVALRVDDVAPHGYARDRATVMQRKTKRPVKFELSEHTRAAVSPRPMRTSTSRNFAIISSGFECGRPIFRLLSVEPSFIQLSDHFPGSIPVSP